MITADCDLIHADIDAFVDGELRGADLRRVASHLESCRSCAEEVADRRHLGGLIREAVAAAYQQPIPQGLAAGVVARTRAESYFSWRAGLGRALEDWHWVIVGGGAVTSTFLSMMLCAAMLLFGTATPNAASLSALGNSLRASPGSLYAEVSQRGSGLMLVQVDTGDGVTTPLPPPLRRGGEERDLVDALGQTLDRWYALGHWESMPEAQRRYAESLIDNIARARLVEPEVNPVTPLTVYRLHLVANTDVTAKELN
jgi:hypothetical protein